MRRKMIQMLVGCALFFGAIFAFQMFKMMMFKKYMGGNKSPAVAVSAETVDYQIWQSKLQLSGGLRAMQGTEITTEAAGMIKHIRFSSGHKVEKGDLLVELNIDSDLEHLGSLKAMAELSQITYERDKLQFEAQAISESTIDAGYADLKSKKAQVAEQEAMIAKKLIRAPFSGYLGVSEINEGQYLNPGDKIVSLQSLEYVYVDFYIPQQNFINIKAGSNITVVSDAYPDKQFSGKISAIDPKVDPKTRNIHVQATICNTEQKLLPGMFVTVQMAMSDPVQYLTLPQTAIAYNPYGETVFVVVENKPDKKGNIELTATQKFIKVGEARGDQIAITDGIQKGDRVVTSGQFKLKNGDRILINNTILPGNDPTPQTVDE